MAWVMILAAGLFETGFAVALKLSHGMTRLWWTVTFAACALTSFALLTMALRELEVGAAYAVWTGIGAAGAALVTAWSRDLLDRIRRTTSISPLTAVAMPSASSNPAQGLSSKVRPPSRPMKNE